MGRPAPSGAAMSKTGRNWSRAKASKPKLPATVIWTHDHMGIRAKRAFIGWSQSLTSKQRRKLTALLR
jgi:hypothetical protein